MRSSRTFAVVVGLGALVAGVLLWPRFAGDDPSAVSARDAARRGRALRDAAKGASPRAEVPDSADGSTGRDEGGAVAASDAGAAGAAADGGAPDAGSTPCSASDERLCALPQPVPSYVRIHPDRDVACPAGMALVEGVHCPFVAHRCLEPRGAGPSERCNRYGPRFICEGKPAALRFCIDRYEYPNLRGLRPAVRVRYSEAEAACRIEGKRLCHAEEWAMACEGPGTWPYPYGVERDAQACNDALPDRHADARALGDPRQVSVEMERIDGREPAGARPGCVSRWGVYDLVGNAEEWVTNRRGKRRGKVRESALAGGGWTLGPSVCRQLDSSHGVEFRAPETGFRCCSDPLDGRAARRHLAKGFRLGRTQRILGPEELPEPTASRR